MWAPDIKTLFIIIVLVNALLSLLLYAFWKTQKTYEGFFIWMMSLLCQSVAYLFFMLRGDVSDLLSVVVANTLAISAIMLRIDGIRRFTRSQPLHVWIYAVLLPVFLTYFWFTFVTDSIVWRAFISTLFFVPALFIAGVVALPSREQKNLLLRYLFAGSLIAPGIVLIARLCFWVLVPLEYTLFSGDLLNTIFFIVAILADIVATGFFLTLNMVRSQKELSQTNDKLNLVSSITRHDIGNQLVALSGYLELSRRSLGNKERSTELIAKEEKIVSTITHQIHFSGDYERMGVAQPEWQNVGAIVRKAAASLPIQNIRIDVASQDLEVFADPLLVTVFYNLIDNTLRHGGTGLTKILVSSSESPHGLSVIFADDGAGIAGGDKRYLFERGYGKNTGLGLFLSRQILAITSITITETGETGKGSRFEMLVPKGEYRFSPPL